MGALDSGCEDCHLCVFLYVDYVVRCVGDLDLVVLHFGDSWVEERCGLAQVWFHEDLFMLKGSGRLKVSPGCTSVRLETETRLCFDS